MKEKLEEKEWIKRGERKSQEKQRKNAKRDR